MVLNRCALVNLLFDIFVNEYFYYDNLTNRTSGSHYEGWKKAFESDPIGRRKSGVKNYRIYRPADNPNYVIIHLQFEDAGKALMALDALENLWSKVEGTVMLGPKTKLLDVAEFKEY